jgi:hypothetical protein
MHTPEIVQRFIQLRAHGWTYSRLLAEINVSRPTLIDWSRKHQFEVQNSHAIELEALREKWLSSTADPVKALGEQLHRLQSELEKRDLSALSTPQLMFAVRSLRRQITQATRPLQFSVPLSAISAGEHHEHVHHWKVWARAENHSNSILVWKR